MNPTWKMLTRSELRQLRFQQTLVYESMTPEQERMCRYTFKHAGRLVSDTYEQWERGFLTERNMDHELRFWVIAVTYIRMIEDESKRTMNDVRRKKLIGELCGFSLGGQGNNTKIRDWFAGTPRQQYRMHMDRAFKEMFQDAYRGEFLDGEAV